MLELRYLEKGIEVGCDEAGRGCLAGPVVAAAVILPPDFKNELLNDSKKLKEKDRDALREVIINEALAYSIGVVDNNMIDKINILNASFLAMHIALNQIEMKFNYILVDGNRFNKYKNVRHYCMVKGDARFMSIAAASILAKTERDRIMQELDLEYPQYNWKKNKGYPTKDHRAKIEEFGICDLHRKSFRLYPDQLSLNFEEE